MKVAVIGAGGFVGARVAHRLAGRADVTEIALLDRVPFAHPLRAGIIATVGDFADSATLAAALQGADKVIRGGAWSAGNMVWVRPSFRFHFPPTSHTHGIGFRCASSVR